MTSHRKPRAAKGAAAEFLQAHVAHEGDDCVMWPFGFFPNGYGSVIIGGVQKTASRWMCILAHGEPPSKDHDAAHSCGNRRCINRNHLRWATKAENEADKEGHGTKVNGERHGMTRLSDSDIYAIRTDNRRQQTVAADYGVSQTTISNIRVRRAWKHVA